MPARRASASKETSASRLGNPSVEFTDIGPPITTTPSKPADSSGTSSPSKTRRVSTATPAATRASSMANADSGATCWTTRQFGIGEGEHGIRRETRVPLLLSG